MLPSPTTSAGATVPAHAARRRGSGRRAQRDPTWRSLRRPPWRRHRSTGSRAPNPTWRTSRRRRPRREGRLGAEMIAPQPSRRGRRASFRRADYTSRHGRRPRGRAHPQAENEASGVRLGERPGCWQYPMQPRSAWWRRAGSRRGWSEGQGGRSTRPRTVRGRLLADRRGGRVHVTVGRVSPPTLGHWPPDCRRRSTMAAAPSLSPRMSRAVILA